MTGALYGQLLRGMGRPGQLSQRDAGRGHRRFPGIGRALAEQLVAGGAHVAIGDVDLDLAKRTAEEIGHGTVALPLDVRDTASFAAFLDDATARLDGLDVLVNNAGIMPIGPFLSEDDSVTDRAVDVDLRGC